MGETLQKLPETMGETQGETLDVSPCVSHESQPESFLQYNQYIEPQNPSFQRKKKNQFLERIQNIENKYQTSLSSLQLVLIYFCNCLITQKEV